MYKVKVALLFYLVNSNFVFAQDSKMFLNLLGHAFSSVENTEYKWRIERTFEPNEEILKELEGEYEAKIKGVELKDPQATAKIGDFKSQLNNRKAIFGSRRKKELEITVSYLNSRQWYAKQSFIFEKDVKTIEYFYGKSGVAYVVTESIRSVNVVDHATGMLSSLVSGHPLLVLGSCLDAVKKISFSQKGDRGYKVKIETEGQGYFTANIDMTTFVPKYLCYYGDTNKIFELKALGLFDSKKLLPNMISYTQFLADGEKIDYSDIWTLVSVRPIMDPSSIKTEYKLKSGYSVLMSTGSKMITINSDDIILNKKNESKE